MSFNLEFQCERTTKDTRITMEENGRGNSTTREFKTIIVLSDPSHAHVTAFILSMTGAQVLKKLGDKLWRPSY
ncbi:hypothetical protein QQP08_000756 [Theobroma cacao]|nr:hypothetical protein QQP08_000756 [Theobroma cacao]